MATAVVTRKPGFSIRKLIPRRHRNEDVDDEGFDFKDIGLTDDQVVSDKTEGLARRPSVRRRPSQPLAAVTNTTASSSKASLRLSMALPPLPDTPNSSSSSLGSYEESNARGRNAHEDPALCQPVSNTSSTETTSGSKRSNSQESKRLSTHFVVSGNEDISALSSTVSAATTTATTTTTTPTNPSPSSPAYTLDSEEPITPGSNPQAVEQKESPTLPERRDSRPSWSDSRQHSNQETEKSSSAASTAPNEDPQQLAPWTLHKSQPTLTAETQLKPRPAAAQMSRPKRKKSRKRRKSRAMNARRSRWGLPLPGNLTEFFNEHLVFSRVEADEMLPLQRLEEIRKSKYIYVEADSSPATTKSTETEESETPVEPFHLQDLPARIGAAGVRLSKLSIPATPASLPTAGTAPAAGDAAASLAPTPLLWTSADGAVKVHDFSAAPADSSTPSPGEWHLSPPPRNPARGYARRHRQQSPHMPTIPEVLTSPTEAPPPIPARKPRHRRQPPADDFVYFNSTPLALAMPGVRHGRIRFTKAALGLEPKLPPDETLDWTAFQMAILGGAGDWFSESTDYTTRPGDNDDAELDELAAWLDGFGVGGCGGLITRAEDDAAASLMAHDSGSSRSASVSGSSSNYSGSATSSAATSPATDRGELPIPVDTEHPTGFWNVGTVDSSRFVPGAIKRWTVEGHPKRYSGGNLLGRSNSSSRAARRASAESLPQSPMLDMVVSRDSSGVEYVVPMGYNLGHDLGDYLVWESEQLFAGSFSESGRNL